MGSASGFSDAIMNDAAALLARAAPGGKAAVGAARNRGTGRQAREPRLPLTRAVARIVDLGRRSERNEKIPTLSVRRAREYRTGRFSRPGLSRRPRGHTYECPNPFRRTPSRRRLTAPRAT